MNKSVTLYTSTIKYNGEDKLDITVKSSQGIGRLYRPTWKMVCGHKAFNGDKRFIDSYEKVSDEEYKRQYFQLLGFSRIINQKDFLSIFEKDYVLCCYCGAGKFCHRLLLVKEYLPQLAEEIKIQMTYGGEIK